MEPVSRAPPEDVPSVGSSCPADAPAGGPVGRARVRAIWLRLHRDQDRTGRRERRHYSVLRMRQPIHPSRWGRPVAVRLTLRSLSTRDVMFSFRIFKVAN